MRKPWNSQAVKVYGGFPYLKKIVCRLEIPEYKILSRSYLQYIGSLDVPRPNNRMEIVAAMRRIRVSSLTFIYLKRLN